MKQTQCFVWITYLLPPGGCRPRSASPPTLCSISCSPFLVGWPTWIGASGPRLQGRSASAQPATVQPLHQSQEGPLPRVPRQQAVDQPSTAPHDLAGHPDRGRTERRELHPQQRSFLRLVLGRSRGAPVQQGTPSLQAPGQDWPSPYTPSCSPSRPPASQRVHAALELGEQVLLVAAVVGREHDLVGRWSRDRW